MTTEARLESLLDPDRLPVEPTQRGGYLNLVGEVPPATTIGARTMRTRFYPVYYERLRPLGLRIATGLREPGRDGDRRQLAERLHLNEGATVLDLACGPGNFTRFLGESVGAQGLAVGLDASDTMLDKAVAANSGSSVVYARGDAEALPFRDGSFDAVACLAALYLINRPYDAIAEAVRVLRPGGSLAILTSYIGDHPLQRLAGRVNEAASGIHSFGRTDITAALEHHGLVDVHQSVNGLAQSVWARTPS
ncbi:MAG TPA: methyltransferase domain-containing protein [Nocardioidaceae bacterium]|nr:methyltransferase domain-containing protein [Nocardioidaceae bacterium]